MKTGGAFTVELGCTEPGLAATLAEVDRMPPGPDRDEMVGTILIAVGQVFLKDAHTTRGWRRADHVRRGGRRKPTPRTIQAGTEPT